MDIGDYGENFMDRLCIKEDIKSHPPKRDVNGWDYHLEHPELGQQPSFFGLIKSYVQVKTTSPEYKRPKLSLSSLMTLINTDVPAFIVHLICDGDEIISSRIFHVNEDVMKFAIKKLRQRTLKWKKANESEYEMKLRWSKELFIGGLNQQVLNVVMEHGSFAEYVAAKASARQCCSDAIERMVLDWRPDAEQTAYAPEAYGGDLITLRRYDKIGISKSRFGVILPDEYTIATDGILIKMRGPNGKSNLRFEAGGQSVAFYNLNYYVEKSASGAFHRRYTTFIFDFTFEVGEDVSRFDWNVDFSCRFIMPYPVIRKHLNAIKNLLMADGDLQLAVEDSDNKWRLQAKINIHADYYKKFYYMLIYVEHLDDLYENQYDISKWEITPNALFWYYQFNLPILDHLYSSEFSNIVSTTEGGSPKVGKTIQRSGTLVFDGYELDLVTESTLEDVTLSEAGIYSATLSHTKTICGNLREKKGDRSSFIPVDEDVRIPEPDISKLNPWDLGETNFYD